ncbi:MAG: hypothetical protein AUI16_16465 [Alphaproteobacteria bacterium 13_2_20CM_2_64_7]|jgi:hypothetical protein|nr:MAG: hypothetical protein AUI16_16465 [Alphaproteobacteria bacterium 13_2_20CM_2_64_7]
MRFCPRGRTEHRAVPTLRLWNGPESAKKQENTGNGATSAALAAVLWKPHPEEARSAVSKDEASDPFALMLRDAARVRAAPQHEGGFGPA